MRFQLFYTDKFEKSLDKIDKFQAQKILKYLKKNIDGSGNPRAFGKALPGNRNGQWRYRVGDYRVICDIQDEKCVVLALETGHRRDVHK